MGPWKEFWSYFEWNRKPLEGLEQRSVLIYVSEGSLVSVLRMDAKEPRAESGR